MAALTAHPFEGDPTSPQYCKVCKLPPSNRLHAGEHRRSRLVVVLDVPKTMSDADLQVYVAGMFEQEVHLVAQDVQVIP